MGFCFIASILLVADGKPIFAQNFIKDYNLLTIPQPQETNAQLPPKHKYPDPKIWYFRSLIAYHLPQKTNYKDNGLVNNYLQSQYNRMNNNINNLQYNESMPSGHIIIESQLSSHIMIGLNFGYGANRIRFLTNDAILSQISVASTNITINPEISFYLDSFYQPQEFYGRPYIGMGYGINYNRTEWKDGTYNRIIGVEQKKLPFAKIFLGWNYDFDKILIGSRYEAVKQQNHALTHVMGLDARWGF